MRNEKDRIAEADQLSTEKNQGLVWRLERRMETDKSHQAGRQRLKDKRREVKKGR